MSDGRVSQMFGGSPGNVLVRLAVASLVAGIVLGALGVSPYDIVNGLTRLLGRVWEQGFEMLELIWRYFVLGAVVVVPVWLVVRLLRYGRRRS